MQIKSILINTAVILCNKATPITIANAMCGISSIEERPELKNTIINPIFGFLFIKSGCIHRMRFYSPFTSIFFNSKGRIHLKDSNKDSAVRSLIELFPSEKGKISTSRKTDNSNNDSNHDSNNESIFIRPQLRTERKNSIITLARLFVSLVDEEYVMKYPENLNKEAKSAFMELKKSLKNESKLEIFKNKNHMNKFIIHAFAVEVLDTEEDIKAYITEILDELKLSSNEKLNTVHKERIEEAIMVYPIVDDDITQLIADAYISNNYFPYSESRKPPRLSNSYAKSTTITILHLLNSLFYNTETFQYDLSHLNLPVRSPLLKFYKAHKEIYQVTEDVVEEFSIILEKLQDLESLDINDYNTDKIAYKDKNRRLLQPGLINMMCVLAHICGIRNASTSFKSQAVDTGLKKENEMSMIDRSAIFRGLDSKNARKQFELLLKKLATPAVSKISVRSVEEREEKKELRRFDYEYNFDVSPKDSDFVTRRDISGSFEIGLWYNTKNSKTVVTVEHTETESEFQFSGEQRQATPENDMVRIMERIKPFEGENTLSNLLITRGVKLMYNQELPKQGEFADIYINGLLSSDFSIYNNSSHNQRHKIEFLTEIVERIEDNEEKNYKLKEELKDILRIALEPVKQTSGVFMIFVPFMLYMNERFESDAIFSLAWSEALRLNNQKILNQWCKIAIKRKQREIEIELEHMSESMISQLAKVGSDVMENTSFKLVVSSVSSKLVYFLEKINFVKSISIGHLSGDVEPRVIEHIAEALKKTKYLEELEISGAGLSPSRIQPLVEAVRALHGPLVLSISNNNFSSSEALDIIKTIKGSEVNSLTMSFDNIDISDENVEEFAEVLKKIRKTGKPFKLNLSNNDIPRSIQDKLQGILKSEILF